MMSLSFCTIAAIYRKSLRQFLSFKLTKSHCSVGYAVIFLLLAGSLSCINKFHKACRTDIFVVTTRYTV